MVDDTRDEVADETIRQSAQIPYASHNWHPFCVQGTKTIAYAMWEALGFTAPDNVVLVGQPEHWATIADTVNGRDSTQHEPRVPTIAEGASIARPVRLAEAVEAIVRSDGVAISVTEDEIHAAVRKLASRGLYAEPTSSVAAAALDRFVADGTIEQGQTTVVVLTSGGVKATDAMASVFDQDRVH